MARANEAMRNLLRFNNAVIPQKTSRFDKSHSHTTTFDSGYIIPLDWDRVLPGDEKQIKFNGLCRMATPLHPTMDHCNLDVWCFFVPDRLWFKHTPEFYGENLDADFNEDGEYVMPYLKPSQYRVDPEGSFDENGVGSLNDYFGFPVMKQPELVDDDPKYWASAGLHRCYAKIWNDWFRNSAIQSALRLNDGDSVTEDEWHQISQLRLANKYPDYFTTLLREPQAGDDVMIPLGDYLPVVTLPETNDEAYSYTGMYGLTWFNTSTQAVYTGDSRVLALRGTDGYTAAGDSSPGNLKPSVVPANLYGKLSSLEMATINNLRSAITIQHFLETKNIAGNRFQSIIKSFFGVFTADATLQRPELLGATRQQVGVRTVVSTAETSDAPLGSLAGISMTNISNAWICNKAFTEPGFIMVLGCVRPETSYSQGLDPLLTKLDTYEHYWPCFDNIGNQPVYKHNLYADGNDSDVLGYAPAWVEYRVKQNRVSGLMRPDVPANLSSWNFSTYYNSVPLLDSQFIQVDPQLIDRTIATPDEPQFICDCWFDYIDVKLMSVHSTPGVETI